MAKKSFDDLVAKEEKQLPRQDVIAIVSTADPSKFVDIVKLNGRAIAIKESCQRLEIVKDEDESRAADMLKEIKLISDEAEGLRKEKVNPFNQLVKRVNDLFRPVSTDLEEAGGLIKSKVLSYRQRKEQARIAEEKKRNEEYQKKLEEERKKAEAQKKAFVPPPPPPVLIPTENVVRGSSGSLLTRKTWTFKVVDISKVPVEYLLVNDKMVKAKISGIVQSGGHPENAIPGIEAFQEENISGGR